MTRDRSCEIRLKAWTRPAVLILGDFAMRDFTPSQADVLYELVTDRTKKSPIITDDRAVSDWYTRSPTLWSRSDPRPHRQRGPLRLRGRQLLLAQKASRCTELQGQVRSESHAVICDESAERSGDKDDGPCHEADSAAQVHRSAESSPGLVSRRSSRGVVFL